MNSAPAALPTSEPSDTSGSARSGRRRTAGPSGIASGDEQRRADCRGHAAAAVEVQEDRLRRAHDAGHAGQRHAQRRGAKTSAATAPARSPSARRASPPATARRAPIARSALVPPVRPLPTVRGSRAPVDPRNDHAHRQRPRQIAEHDEENVEEQAAGNRREYHAAVPVFRSAVPSGT